MSVWTVSRPATDSGLDRAPCPLAAVLDRQVATGVPDERDAVAPVLAREPEAGEVGRLRVGLLEVDGGLDELVHGRRHRRCRPSRRGPCGRRRTSSRRSRARRTSCRRRSRRRRSPGAGRRRRRSSRSSVRSANAPAVGERRRLRVADLDHVGGLGLAGQRGGELLDQALPLLLLDRQRRAGVLVLEGRLQPVPRAACGVSAPLSQTRMSAVSAPPSPDASPSSSSPHALQAEAERERRRRWPSAECSFVMRDRCVPLRPCVFWVMRVAECDAGRLTRPPADRPARGPRRRRAPRPRPGRTCGPRARRRMTGMVRSRIVRSTASSSGPSSSSAGR